MDRAGLALYGNAMKPRLLALAALSLLMLSTVQADDGACMPPRGEVQIWVLPKPIVLNYWIWPEVPRPDIVERAFAAWNSPAIRFNKLAGWPDSYGVGGNLHIVVAWDENIPAGRAITYSGWPSAIVLRPSGVYPENEIDYGSVLAHEVGHVIGLGHSTCQNSVMYPFYSSLQWERVNPMDAHARDLMYPWPNRVFLPHVPHSPA